MTDTLNWQNFVLSVILGAGVIFICYSIRRLFHLKEIQGNSVYLNYLLILSIFVVFLSLYLLALLITQPILSIHYISVIGLLLTSFIIKFAVNLNYESAVASIKSSALENYYTTHDDLTGLPNLSFFNNQLEKLLGVSRREDDVFALLLIGLNRFKIINETLGYFVGDAILQEITQRIRTSLRKTDLIARLGGDEFVVLINPVEAQGHIHTIANNIAKSVQEPLAVQGNPADVGVSIGVAIYPKHANNSVALIEKARNAMMVAEKHGHGVFVYDDVAADSQIQDIQIIGMLQRAIQDEQLVILYQPQVRLSDKKIISAEALLRWQHPNYGMLDPGSFIPYAEKAGLMYEINLWLLNKVVMLLVSWQEKKIQLPIAFNITAHGFVNKDFQQQLNAYLKRHTWLAERIKIELTETSSIEHIDQVREAMILYKKYGLSFSLDDYGTKHASLEYLHKLPFDELKIDQLFMANATSDENSQAIIQHAKDIAEQLKLSTTAEGIENEEVFKIAKQFGINNGQGFYFSEAQMPRALEKQIPS